MNHPDDERLAALAGQDPEAAADVELASHVAGCSSCANVVAEITTLRASLAELPDLVPPRPLRLLPASEPPPPSMADRLGGWARRAFAPLATAGAALALVGAVGTAAPAFSGMPSSGNSNLEAVTMQATDQAAPELDGAAASEQAAGEGDDEEPRALAYGRDSEATRDPLPADRSPWPMVLFSGIAIVVGAVGLRWILAPRSG